MAAAARELVKKADQKLQAGPLKFLFGGPAYGEACDIYVQAANQFKLAKEWQEAANCYAQCAFCATKEESLNDAANYHMEAGHVLKKISTQQAVEEYEKAISIYSTNGKFQQSGKLLLQIAELYESERLQHKETKEYYQRAAEMFDLDEHSKSNRSKCLLKVAEYAAKDGELQEAIKIFETEGEKALAVTTLQFGAKEHFLKAGILHLVQGDTVSINIAVEKYRSLDPRFAGSREGELLQNLAEAFEGQDVDAFVEKLQDYDQVTKLDAWKTEMLVKVKESMQPNAQDVLSGAVDLT
mmetsp:Transcript_68825/g.165211  ORF Transcript_68825/g.165211 Transcript_68825/m.165211 type:complete len:297 (+) Transcript_68825:155-1045(+)